MNTRCHTPGPWEVRPNDNSGYWEVYDGAGYVCDAESESTASLIAAAPEMLEVLQRAEVALDVLAEDIEDTYPTRAENTATLAMEIRSTIHKATGR